MSESLSNPASQPPIPVCNECGGRLIPIVYGMPAFELFEAAERGEVVLGGCLVMDGAPEERCADCGAEAAQLA